MKRERKVIETYDEMMEQAQGLPFSDGQLPKFAVTNPIEMYFIEVADKHGIIDCANDDMDDYEQ